MIQVDRGFSNFAFTWSGKSYSLWRRDTTEIWKSWNSCERNGVASHLAAGIDMRKEGVEISRWQILQVGQILDRPWRIVRFMDQNFLQMSLVHRLRLLPNVNVKAVQTDTSIFKLKGASENWRKNGFFSHETETTTTGERRNAKIVLYYWDCPIRSIEIE